MTPAWINHLWQSTVFCVAMAVLTLAFRNSKAQVRFWLWFSASVKFLLPFSLLLMAGSYVTPKQVQQKAPKASAAILQVAEPFPQPVTAVAVVEVRRDWTPLIMITLWACGFAAVAIMRFRSYRRIRKAVNSSTLADLKFPVEIRYSTGSLEPGVFGIWRPVLLLPADAVNRLSPAQFQAVLAHELCHVRRRDNLTASIHIVVEAIFWFHPLVWWIGTKLVEERERACDEAVLSTGSAPQDYAEGILSVCKSYFESPLRSFSGVTGSDLKKRIQQILAGGIGSELRFGRKIVLAFSAFAAIAVPVTIGVMNATAIRAQSGNRPQFEVASIHRCEDNPLPGGRGGGARFSPGSITLNCQSVAGLINAAYVLFADGTPIKLFQIQRIPVEGGPAWIQSERYSVSAKAADPATASAMQGPYLQTLLESRFHLKIHRETREIPVYDLVVAKGGPKLTAFKEGSCTPMPELDPARPPGALPALPSGQHYCNLGGGGRGGNFAMHFEGATITEFAKTLQPDGEPVVDKTNISGKYDIHLEFAATEESRQRRKEITGVEPPESTAPSFFVAIQEQLGLKVQPAKGTGEFLVIDHVERPDEN